MKRFELVLVLLYVLSSSLLCSLSLVAASSLAEPASETNGTSSAIVCHRTARVAVIECYVERAMREFENKDLEVVTPMDARWWWDLGIVVFLVLVAGMMSGLTIGLMGIDQTTLDILAKSGTPEQRRKAKRLVPLLRQHHLLLVTLLLCNAAAMEALPVFLEHLVPPAVAIIVSVTLVLLFGEIIPQAICNRYALSIGYYLAYVVWGLIVLTGIISWPISKLLDLLLGTGHATFYRRQELRELVAMHAASAEAGHGRGAEALSNAEVTLLRSVLELHSLPVRSVCVPLRDATLLALDTPLDAPTLQRLARTGHARIPVYRHARDHVLGYVTLAQLLHAAASAAPASVSPRLAALELQPLPRIAADTPLSVALGMLRSARMALVTEEQRVLGLVTLADALGALLRDEKRGHSSERLGDKVRRGGDVQSGEETYPELAQVYFGSDDDEDEEDDLEKGDDESDTLGNLRLADEALVTLEH